MNSSPLLAPTPSSASPAATLSLFISVVVPVRNEARFIERTLESLLSQEYDPARFEILVVDGGSGDGTPDIVANMARNHPNLRLFHNARRLSSAARNIGVRNSRGEVILVVDGHCELTDRQHFRRLASAFTRSNADCIGRPQPLNVAGATTLQRAIAAARSSRLGHLPASFIYSSSERFVPAKSVAVAYRREVFDRVGYFDETFDACEDVEFNHRIDLAGLKCFFTPEVAVHYAPRNTLRGLFRQLFRYGRGRARLLRKHPETFSASSLVPGLFVAGVLLGPLAGLIWSPLAVVYLATLLFYAAIVVAGSFLAVGNSKDFKRIGWLPLVFATVHVGAGTGLLWEAISRAFGGKPSLSIQAASQAGTRADAAMTVKTDRRIKAGIVGAGGISEFHVKGLRRIPFVDIIGVADVDESRARELARRFAIPRSFPSLAALLEAGPDVVHVLTPPEFHADNAIEAIRGGCHVLVEKPLATRVEDCERIAAAAREAGKLVCVGHSLLRDPFVARALEIVRSGTIGEVVGVDHFRSQFYAPYAGGPLPYQYRDGGFPFRDLGVHSLYMLEAFLGGIEDATLQLGPPSRDGCPTYKEWRVLVRCARGMGQVYLSWNVQPMQDMLVVHGTRGVMRADIGGMSVTVRKKGRLPGPAQRILNSVGEGRRMMTQVAGNVGRVLRKKLLRYHGLQMLIGEFYESLRTGAQPPVTIEQARPIIDWTERLARQADQAKVMHISQFATPRAATTLVTGATGFIGRHLLRRLLAERDRVRILVRHNPGESLLGDDRVEVVLGNLGNRDDVDRAVQGTSEVFHLGATVDGWAEDFQCATVLGTRYIVDSALAHGVQKLIYMSSLSVIGASSARKGAKITEDWPLEPYPESRGLYSQTKLEAERIVSDAVRERNLRCIILRPGEVIGPDRPFLSGAVAIETGSRLVMLGNGRFTLPLIWVEDLVDAIMAAAKSNHFDGTVLHLVDPESLSQDDIAKFYLSATGSHKRLLHAPLSLLYCAAFGANALFRLLGRNAPLTPYRLRSAIGCRHFDASLAARELDWQPRVGVREGLSRMSRHCY